MSLNKSLKEIKKSLKKRYKDNLVAILIFGSANTGEWKEGISDIDNMIFLKNQKGLDLKREQDFLLKELKKYNFATQYFHTLGSIKKYLKERSSWSTYITIISNDGSKVLYSTPEFRKLKKWLKKNPPTKKGLKKYLKRKDKVELEGYFRKSKNYKLMKALFAHLRRKVQIINYYENKKIIFDFEKCLKKINLENEDKTNLKKLQKYYKEKKALSINETKNYYKLAKKLTNKILKELK